MKVIAGYELEKNKTRFSGKIISKTRDAYSRHDPHSLWLLPVCRRGETILFVIDYNYYNGTLEQSSWTLIDFSSLFCRLVSSIIQFCLRTRLVNYPESDHPQF